MAVTTRICRQILTTILRWYLDNLLSEGEEKGAQYQARGLGCVSSQAVLPPGAGVSEPGLEC